MKCFLSHGGILKNAEILRAINDPVGPQSSESMAERCTEIPEAPASTSTGWVGEGDEQMGSTLAVQPS